MSDTVAVLGPGAVGGALGVRIAQAGERVICVARPETAAAIAGQGLTLVTDDGEETVQLEAVEELAEPVDLLLVTVKSYSLDDAISRIERGAGGRSAAAERPRAHGRPAQPLSQRPRRDDRPFRGLPRVTDADRPADSGARERCRQQSLPEQLVRGGIDTVAGGSDEDVLWWKLARQGPIAVLTAVLGKPIGELRSDPRLRLAVEEACAVAAADGAHTTFDEQWSIIETLPGWATSSTERDVTAGLPSELDHIGGGIVRAGRRLGVPTPTLETLLEQCPA